MQDLTPQFLEPTIAILAKYGITATAHFGVQQHSLTPGPYLHITADTQLPLFSTRNSLLTLLDGFYREQGIRHFNQILVVRRIGALGDCLVTNLGADCFDLLSESEALAKLDDYKREYTRWNEYLAAKLSK